MITAAKRYDAARGSFAAFATWWVRHEIGRLIEDESATVRVSAHTQALRRKAGELQRAQVCSLDAPAGESGSHLDLLAGPEPDSDRDDLPIRDLESVLEATPELSARERWVLRWASTGHDMAAVGRELQVSRERARQILLEAIAKIRSALGVEAGDDETSQKIARLGASKARTSAWNAQQPRKRKARAA